MVHKENMMDKNKLFGIKDVAESTGYDPQYLRGLCKSGKLTTAKLIQTETGTKWVMDPEELKKRKAETKTYSNREDGFNHFDVLATLEAMQKFANENPEFVVCKHKTHSRPAVRLMPVVVDKK